MSMLDEILAMGFSGYATINGTPLPLLPMEPSEEDNLQLSSAPFTTNSSFAVGQMVARDRRALRLSMSTYLCKALVGFPRDLTYGPWRDQIAIDSVTPALIKVFLGNGEGYDAKAYIDSVSITVQENSLVGLNITATAWEWEDLIAGTPTLPTQKALEPFSNEYKPIPHWLMILESSVVGSSTVLNFSVNFNNNWQYEQLLEGYSSVPNPANIYPGPLEIDLTMSWLAKRSDRPKETGNALIRVRDPIQFPTLQDLLTLTIPLMTRTSRSARGVGDGNSPVRWEASYLVLETKPT